MFSAPKIRPKPNGSNQAIRVVFSLMIINKAGGLVYQRDFNTSLNKLSINDYLVLAGTFQGYTFSISLLRLPSLNFYRVHAITKQLTPTQLSIPSLQRTGLEVLETAFFRMTCFQTVSGTKFLLFTEPQQPNVDNIMRKIYELYADYVTKNPFYQMEMPIRCEAFERHLLSYLRAK